MFFVLVFDFGGIGFEWYFEFFSVFVIDGLLKSRCSLNFLC